MKVFKTIYLKHETALQNSFIQNELKQKQIKRFLLKYERVFSNNKDVFCRNSR